MDLSQQEKIAKIAASGSSGQIEKAAEIAVFLADEDLEVAGQACFYLGYLGSREFMSDMLALLSSEDPGVLNWCLSGIALIATTADSQLTGRASVFLDHPSSLVRVSAVEVLGNIADKESSPLLIQRLMHEKPAVQLEIVRALGKIGDKHALPVLREFAVYVDGMDAPPLDLGGVRGSDPHPSVLRDELREAMSKLRG